MTEYQKYKEYLMQEKAKGRKMMPALSEKRFKEVIDYYNDDEFDYKQVAMHENFDISAAQIRLLENWAERLKEKIKLDEAVIDKEHINQYMYREIIEKYGLVSEQTIIDYIMSLTKDDFYKMTTDHFGTFKRFLQDSNMSEEEIDLIPS